MTLFEEFLSTIKHVFINTEDGEYDEEVYSYDEQDEFIVMTISPSRCLITEDFKTSINRLDAVSRKHVMLFMFKCGERQNKPRTITPITEVKGTRNIYIVEQSADMMQQIETAIEHLWYERNVNKYLTSFSKLSTGGSIYIVRKEDPNVCPKGVPSGKKPVIPHCGFEMTEYEKRNIERLMQKKIEEDMLLWRKDELVYDGKELVEVYCHELKNHETIIEIAVASFPGCVFYDKLGPKAYRLNNHNIERIPLSEWVQIIERENSQT